MNSTPYTPYFRQCHPMIRDGPCRLCTNPKAIITSLAVSWISHFPWGFAPYCRTWTVKPTERFPLDPNLWTATALTSLADRRCVNYGITWLFEDVLCRGVVRVIQGYPLGSTEQAMDKIPYLSHLMYLTRLRT